MNDGDNTDSPPRHTHATRQSAGTLPGPRATSPPLVPSRRRTPAPVPRDLSPPARSPAVERTPEGLAPEPSVNPAAAQGPAAPAVNTATDDPAVQLGEFVRAAVDDAVTRLYAGDTDAPAAHAAIGTAQLAAARAGHGSVYRDDLNDARVLIDSFAASQRLNEPTAGGPAPATAAASLDQIGGELCKDWNRARHHATGTLHMSHESHTTVVRIDAVSGNQLADIPAKKPITNLSVLWYTFFAFQYIICARPGRRSLLSSTDFEALSFFIAEADYTAARTDAIECTLRRIFYAYDSGLAEGSVPLAEIIAARGDIFLQSETRRLTACSGGGTSGGSQRKQKQGGGNSSHSPKQSSTGDYCYNFAHGKPCSDNTKVDGICRYETAGKHICGKDIGNGNICRGSHSQNDHE
jgi:hypothetical protein